MLQDRVPKPASPVVADQTPETLRRVDRAMRRVAIEPFVSPEVDRYQTLLANAPVGVYRVSRSGLVIEGNAALARILGYGSVEELIAQSDSGPFGTPVRARFWQMLDREKAIAGYESE